MIVTSQPLYDEGVLEAPVFEGWPKTARLFKNPMVVTEKIDGTNSAVGIRVLRDGQVVPPGCAYSTWDGLMYVVWAQSRSRLIQPGKGTDNYGFAEWVWANADALVRVLGEGLHFGEWWGLGIQRGYDQAEKRLSLFNTSRWGWLADPQARESGDVPGQLGVVPVLTTGTLDTVVIKEVLSWLGNAGSQAAPGFPRPEGVCVYFAGHTFKVTFEGDQAKSLSRPRLIPMELELVA